MSTSANSLHAYNSEFICTDAVNYCVRTEWSSSINILVNIAISNATDTGIYLYGYFDVVRYNHFTIIMFTFSGLHQVHIPSTVADIQ